MFPPVAIISSPMDWRNPEIKYQPPTDGVYQYKWGVDQRLWDSAPIGNDYDYVDIVLTSDTHRVLSLSILIFLDSPIHALILQS